MSDQGNIKIPLLKRNGSWVVWSRKFRASLSLPEPPLDKWLSEEPASADAAERETENRQDAKVKSLMTLTVSADIVSVVENASTAKQAFKGLQALCVKAEQVRRSVLSSTVEKLAQGQAESVDAFISRARLLMTEAQDLKAAASAEQLCLKIVRGLLPNNKQAVGSTALAAANESAPDGRDRTIEESRELFERICSQIAAHCELLVQHAEENAVDDERAAKAFQTVPQIQGDRQQRV
jgi:hypothetical protein